MQNKKNRFIKFFLVYFIINCFYSIVISQEESRWKPTDEYIVKAAFILNFTKFIKWNHEELDHDDKYFKIAILGDDPFGKSIETIGNKKIKGKLLKIDYVKEINENIDYQILYISKSEKENLNKIFDKIKFKNIVTIGDFKGFAEAGGIINFYKFKNKIRFEINIDIAKKNKLSIDSKLLNLAKIIRIDN